MYSRKTLEYIKGRIESLSSGDSEQTSILDSLLEDPPEYTRTCATVCSTSTTGFARNLDALNQLKYFKKVW